MLSSKTIVHSLSRNPTREWDKDKDSHFTENLTPCQALYIYCFYLDNNIKIYLTEFPFIDRENQMQIT